MAFGSLSLNITANIAQLSSALKKATADVKNFKAKADGKLTSFIDTNNGIKNTERALRSLNGTIKEYGFNMQSIKRIVSGIVIAQVFYKALGAIQDCVSATFEFANSLEYAHVAFSNLFNDNELATEFINVLKDFAATTPFDFSESEQAAKRLLAYGIEYKNVMYAMQGVLSAASMQGDPTKVESISRALGQIYTKGRLMNQEMNQLTEAGIPAWEILQEKIGLTGDQIGEIGNLKIPAATALNALIDGMNERFGDVVTASSRTLTGILSNIKDNAIMISAEAFTPLIGQVKAVADALGQWLFKMREIMELNGLGGVFEAIVPQEAQQAIRTFIANLMNLWTVVKYLLASAFEVLKQAIFAVINAFNVLAPAIIITADVLARIIYYISSNATAMRILMAAAIAASTAFVIFKAKALAALVVTAVTKVVIGLAKALLFLSTVLATNPILFLVGALTAGIVGFSVATGGATNAISNFFKKLTSFGGVNADDILMPEAKERTSDINKFNNAFDKTNQNMDDADKKAKKLKDSTDKLRKGLLSFDEVFRLNDNEKGTSSGGGVDDGSGLSYDPSAALGDLDAGAYIPDIPDMTGFGTDFVDALFSSIRDAFNPEVLSTLLSVGLGAGLGMLIGAALTGGSPLGIAIGGFAGAIAGYVWDQIAEALNLSDTLKISIPIGTGIGAAIGGLISGPGGAIIGAAVGTMVGWIMGLIVEGFTTGNWDTSAISTALGGLLGAAIGAIIGVGPIGAIIGAAIGSLVGWVNGKIMDGFLYGDWDVGGISMGLGTLIGGGIGLIMSGGNPAGAIVGGAIGTLVGWVISKISDGFTTGNWDVNAISVSIGGLLGGAIGALTGTGPIGVVIGAAIGSLVGWITGKLVKKFQEADWKAVKKAFMDGLLGNGGIFRWTTDMFKKAGEFFTEAWKAFKEQDWDSLGENILEGIIYGLAGAITAIWEPIGHVFEAIYKAICQFFGIASPAKNMMPIGKYILLGILEGIVGAFTSIPSYITKVGKELISGFSNWFSTNGLSGRIGTWMSEGKQHIVDFVSNTKTNISDWYTNTSTSIKNWATDTSKSFKSWWGDVKEKLGFFTNTSFETWANKSIDAISKWSKDTKASIKTWWSDVKDKFKSFKDTSFSKWATDKAKTITNWATNTSKSIGTWWTNVSGKFSSFKGVSFKGWCNTAYTNIKNWASNVWTSVKDKIGKAIDKIKEFLRLDGAKGEGGSQVHISTSGGNHGGGGGTWGHASGGVFNREHVARFAEGNKAEAIIPLENKSAMQPFVDAVSMGLIETLAPLLANNNTSTTEQLQPLYVGTLIADDRSLRELERKMKIIRLQEGKR